MSTLGFRPHSGPIKPSPSWSMKKLHAFHLQLADCLLMQKTGLFPKTTLFDLFTIRFVQGIFWTSHRCRTPPVTHLVSRWLRKVGYITGCAVVRHCYNGDVSFLWETLTPVKLKPLNRLTHNLSGLITSKRGTVCSKFGKKLKIRSRGTSGQRGEI